MNIAWLLIDVGGPVLHEDIYDKHCADLLFELAQKHGVSIERSAFDKLRRRAIEAHAPSVSQMVAWELCGKSTRLFKKIHGEYRSTLDAMPYEKYLGLTPPTSGMEGVLPALASEYKLALGGNQPEAHTRKVLDHYNLSQHFEVIGFAMSLGCEKPDPRFWLELLNKTGCPLEEAVVVGDSIHEDILPARSLGFKTVRHHVGFMAWQESRGPFELPDKVIDSMEELPGVLEELKEEEA